MCADDLVTLVGHWKPCPEPLKDPAQDMSEMPCAGEAGEPGCFSSKAAPWGWGAVGRTHSGMFGSSLSPPSPPHAVGWSVDDGLMPHEGLFPVNLYPDLSYSLYPKCPRYSPEVEEEEACKGSSTVAPCDWKGLWAGGRQSWASEGA